jgi:hypothetical protein
MFVKSPTAGFELGEAIPSLGDVVGPEDIYSSLQDVSKQIVNLIDYHRKTANQIASGDVGELIEMGLDVDKNYHLRVLHDLAVSKKSIDSCIGVLEKYNGAS